MQKKEPKVVYMYRGPGREIPWREIRQALGIQLGNNAVLTLTLTADAIGASTPVLQAEQPVRGETDPVLPQADASGKRATLADVAREANVSTATVSRVLNNRPVRSEARLRVEAAMARLRFTPNEAARAMAHSKRHREMEAERFAAQSSAA